MCTRMFFADNLNVIDANNRDKNKTRITIPAYLDKVLHWHFFKLFAFGVDHHLYNTSKALDKVCDL